MPRQLLQHRLKTNIAGQTGHYQPRGNYVHSFIIPVPVPDVVGLTLAAATTAIEDASLVVGTVSGDVDPVIEQSPAAGVIVQIGSAVNLTLDEAPPVPGGLDLNIFVNCLVSQGWTAAVTGAEEITVEGDVYTKTFLEACDYSTVSPVPLRIDFCDCAQVQGQCSGGC